MTIKVLFTIFLVLAGPIVSWAPGVISPSEAASKGSGPDYVVLPGGGEKCWIGQEYYFVYQFDKTPKIGNAILKIQVFAKDGNRDTSFEITGDSGMPSMRGAHDTGPVPFKLSQKGDYLLPVDVMMRGEWEIRLSFFKDKKPIFLGSIRFRV